jgi:hypothetical protein
MSSFSRALLPGLLLLLVAAACSSPLDRAGAQDLAVEFHAPAPEAAAPAPKPPAAKPRRAVFQPLPGGKIPARVTRAITPEAPLRVQVVGDSLADGFGMFMIQRVKQKGLPVVVTNNGKTSTGLARADFYNWPANFASQAANLRPDVVVVHFGANDNQPLRLPGGGSVPYDTPEWEAAYRAETRKMLEVAASYNAVVYWLGPAPDRDSHRNALLTKVNGIFREEARAAGAHFISLPAFAAGPNGEFVTTANGTTIRSGDGSHFTVAGYYMVVDRILGAIQGDNPGIFTAPVPPVEVARLLQ